MNKHAIIRFASATLGAIGAGCLLDALLGTTVLVTTSWLTFVLFYVVYVLAFALAMYAGAKAGGWVADKLSTQKFESAGDSVGSALRSVRNMFGSKAAA